MVAAPRTLSRLLEFILKVKKKKKRDRERQRTCRDRERQRRIRERYCSKFPVFADSLLCDVRSLELYRRECDLCLEPLKSGPEKRALGRLVTYVNADKIVHLRYLPELALELYNDNKLRSFKLVKVCKINRGGAGFYWLTFSAQEDGGEECPVFRGVVRVMGLRGDALFCEIKDDDKITLLPWDDDYVGSEQACESEDCLASLADSIISPENISYPLPSSADLRKNVHAYLKEQYSDFKIIDFNFHESLLSPVRKQNETYSCAYVSAVTCIEMLYQKANIKVVPDSKRQYFDIDDLFDNYYKKFPDLEKSKDKVGNAGISMREVLNYILTYGLVVSSACRDPQIKNLYSRFCGKLPRGKILSFEILERSSKAFTYARDTPMIGSLVVYPSFDNLKKVIYKSPSKHEIARARARARARDPNSDGIDDEHAVVVVGNATIRIKNKIKKFFIIQNSYGISFGFMGFALMEVKNFEEVWLVKVPSQELR